MTAFARIERRVNGWSLVPGNEEAKSIVALLYGWDQFQELENDESFQKGVSPEESLDKFLARVLRIAKDTKHLSVSVCGNRNIRPVLRFWDKTPAARESTEKIEVDLKWACWSDDLGIWEDYAPGMWKRMQAAFEGTQPPVEIHTGPRKEIRYGKVAIEKGKAEGYFCTEWDEPSELADTLGLTDENGDWIIHLDPEEVQDLIQKFGQEQINRDQEDAFRESIPFSMHTLEPGMDRDFSVKARTFQRLMEHIDREEDQLLQDDKKEWELIEEIYRKENV